MIRFIVFLAVETLITAIALAAWFNIGVEIRYGWIEKHTLDHLPKTREDWLAPNHILLTAVVSALWLLISTGIFYMAFISEGCGG